MGVLVSGGAGFIGSNFILNWVENELIINLDKLTYAGNAENLSSLQDSPYYLFKQGSINDAAFVSELLNQYQPRAVIHFAAESHVDRSIQSPSPFIETNIVGTFWLLEAVRIYYAGLSPEAQQAFRFIHISTDEVYGALTPEEPPATELNRYQPNSPYAASKAASDHLVRSYYHTYNLPILITHCSNNYGPYHFPEKFIPLMIMNALIGKPLCIYGDGQQIRDWLYVKDHCSALRCVLEKGRLGEVYNIGGWNEKTNLEVAHTLCDLLDELNPRADAQSYRMQIVHVQDRPGHDRRYALNAHKIQQELGWQPQETFETGLRKTVAWYLANRSWVERIQNTAYDQSLTYHYTTEQHSYET